MNVKWNNVIKEKLTYLNRLVKTYPLKCFLALVIILMLPMVTLIGNRNFNSIMPTDEGISQSQKNQLDARFIEKQKALFSVSANTHFNMRWAKTFLKRCEYYPTVATNRMLIDKKYALDFRTVEDMHTLKEQLYTFDAQENQEVLSVTLAQNLTFVNDRISLSDFSGFKTPNEAYTYIQNGGLDVIDYTVKSGDTLSEIASAHNIKVDDMIKDNAFLQNKKYLKIGDKIIINKSESLITQHVRVLETHKNIIEPKKSYVKTADLFIGEKRLKTEGKPGETIVTEEVVYENGVSVSRLEKSQVVLVKPVEVVFFAGTKRVPIKLVSNDFSRPASRYQISSRFGPRSLGYHTGIDLRMPIGSPVYASDRGTVTFAGYRGSYGYLVTINHGNGLETLYAHNSKLLVKVGQTVSKGQKICLSGNTGRSTGPHLHFEVRVNGTAVNPEKYLPF